MPQTIGTLQSVDGAHLHSTRSARVELEVAGKLFICRGSDLELQALLDRLKPAEQLQIWSTPVPNGANQVWQLKRGDETLISYETRRARAIEKDRRTRILAIGMMACAVIAAVVCLVISR